MPLKNAAAFLASGLFLLHPIQTESVTYISGRSELLSTLFYLLAFLVFMKWGNDGGSVPALVVGWVLVGLLFCLGLASKETVITLPVALLAYDLLFRRPTLRLRWKVYLPFAAAAIYSGWVLMTNILSSSTGNAPGHLSAYSYALTQSRVLVNYLGLILWPMHLNLDHDIPTLSRLLSPGTLIPLAVLGLLLLVAWRLRSLFPVAAFAILWFFITLAPTSSFISLSDVEVEHRLYLPMAGLSMLFPLVLLRRESRAPIE